MSKIMKHPENETQNLFFYVDFWKMEEVRQCEKTLLVLLSHTGDPNAVQ